ncbi:Mutant cadherin [Operophtera brumata]|uniref:Mutant cadherin n=1 Tax=Operophtera brumata TaxID=104452 RepID=A0A0L7KKR5_OPEBR|nr:Mutant cadherin [Operophtera brumata]
MPYNGDEPWLDTLRLGRCCCNVVGEFSSNFSLAAIPPISNSIDQSIILSDHNFLPRLLFCSSVRISLRCPLIECVREVMDSESLVRICTTAFSTKDIEKAKMLLFQSINSADFQRIKRQNKDGKSKKDLFDIIEILRIPIFVAHDLNKLPPITFDHVDVSRLLKDIIILQNKITLIKSNYVTTDQLLQTRNEIMEVNKECSRDAGGCVELERAGSLATLNRLFNMNNYRLPDDTDDADAIYQIAKISKLLIPMDNGKADVYKGKSLD